MYADRYAKPTRFNPGSLGLALGLNAAIVAALISAAPQLLPKRPERPMEAIFKPIDPPPPPELRPLPRKVTPPRDELVFVPPQPLPLPQPADAKPMDSTDEIAPPTGAVIGNESAGTVEPYLPLPPAPLVPPSVDPRYAADLQPSYPADERRAEREGKVTIRVLVGIDGRVKDAQRVSATSESFWRATLDRALSKWRFRPATQGGVPVEAWRTMTLTFVLRD